MKIYSTRHGETLWNIENRIVGTTDLPLTERGMNDFSWAGTVFVLFLTPVAITSKMKLLLSYMVGASQDAEFYLIPKTDKTGSELAQYIYEEIKAENASKLSFKWLYSDTFISVMQSLENVSDGEYYLAFKGTSDNSHPMVKSIKFMKE